MLQSSRRWSSVGPESGNTVYKANDQPKFVHMLKALGGQDPLVTSPHWILFILLCGRYPPHITLDEAETQTGSWGPNLHLLSCMPTALSYHSPGRDDTMHL